MMYLLCFLLIVVILLCFFIIAILWNIEGTLCTINVQTDMAYDIINRWAIYYCVEERHKGNEGPYKFILREYEEIKEEIEKMKNEEK